MIRIFLLALLIVLPLIPIIYFKAPNYFVTSIIHIAKCIDDNGFITAVKNSGPFWDSHVEQLINYPGSILIYAITSIVANLDMCLLSRVPIIIIYISILILMIFKLFLYRKNYLLYLGLLLSLNFTVLYPHTWMISYHSLGYLSHLFIIYLMLKVIHTKLQINFSVTTTIILVYLIGVLNYYTSSVFSIIYSLTFSLMFLLFSNSSITKNIINMPIVFLIIYLSFDFMLYFTLINQYNLSKAINYILSSLSNILMTFRTSEKLYLYGVPYHQMRGLLDWSLIIFQYIYILILPFITLLYLLYMSSYKTNNNSILFLFFTSLFSSVITGLSESLPYAFILGGITLRYFSLYTSVILTLILFYFISNRKTHRLISALSLLLFMLFILSGMSVVFKEKILGMWSIKPDLSYSPEYLVLFDKLENYAKVQANFQISGELRYVQVCKFTNKSIINRPFLDNTYKLYQIFSTNNLTHFTLTFSKNNILLSRNDFFTPVWGDVWGYVIPPLNRSKVISALNIFYNSDNFILIYA